MAASESYRGRSSRVPGPVGGFLAPEILSYSQHVSDPRFYTPASQDHWSKSLTHFCNDHFVPVSNLYRARSRTTEFSATFLTISRPRVEELKLARRSKQTVHLGTLRLREIRWRGGALLTLIMIWNTKIFTLPNSTNHFQVVNDSRLSASLLYPITYGLNRRRVQTMETHKLKFSLPFNDAFGFSHDR